MRTLRGVLIGLAALVVLLDGCSATDDRVIGDGAASLVFENDGPSEVSIRVRWTDDEGERRGRSFDVDSDQTVELHLDDRAEYRIRLDFECDGSGAPDQAGSDRGK